MAHRAKTGTIRRVASTRTPTKWGPLQLLGFELDVLTGRPQTETALAVVLGDLSEDAPLLRIHSQCFTSEVLGSLRCDCTDQLQMALEAIAEEGRGLVIYEHQEGRGIGLMAKLQAYALQDAGLDTVDANHALGFEADCRDFRLPVAILHELGISRVRLLSNNPAKSRALIDSGIEIVAQLPCEVRPTPHSSEYLRVKKERLGHTLTLELHDQVKESQDSHHDEKKTIRAFTRKPSQFVSVQAAIDELRAGRMIVVVDDEDRENEGDLTIAAEMVTPQAINFMAKHGRGLICLAMTGERLDQLKLGPMSANNTALHNTAFTISIDAIGHGITTGISAHDRSQTIRAAVDPACSAEDFARPGHIFPLRARDGGVLERRGQTEAAVELAKLAGLRPAGVICEIVNDDGSMARVPDLARFCQKHDLMMVSVADLVRYRLQQDYEHLLVGIGDYFPVGANELAFEVSLVPRDMEQDAFYAECLA